MGGDRDDVARFRRIRDQQLARRDPKAKQRAFQRRVAGKLKRPQLTAGGVVRDLSGKWMGSAAGLIVGILLAVLVNLLVVSDEWWVTYLSYVLVFAGLALGRMFGAMLDWRDEDHDALVKRR